MDFGAGLMDRLEIRPAEFTERRKVVIEAGKNQGLVALLIWSRGDHR